MAEVQNVKPPEELAGGAKGTHIIAYTHKSDGGSGWLPNGVALCHIPNNYDPYVTWNVYLSDRDGLWYAESGHYFRNIFDAVEDYGKRTR